MSAMTLEWKSVLSNIDLGDKAVNTVKRVSASDAVHWTQDSKKLKRMESEP